MPMKPPYWRPEVTAFANLMEKRLRAYDGDKGEEGWKRSSPHQLLAHGVEELSELVETLRGSKWSTKKLELVCHHLDLARDLLYAVAVKPSKNTANEAADAANMLMMFLDVMGVLKRSTK
jgi:hypothetical protein